jgi:peptidoglycan/xylan/chitin deacetylase (PgdA/CDA1 family)
MYDNIKLPFICGMGVSDWEDSVSAEQRAQGVINGACDGQIILLHDMVGNKNTVEALKQCIPVLLNNGAVFMTIRELFENCKVNPVKTHTIWTNVFQK